MKHRNLTEAEAMDLVDEHTHKYGQAGANRIATLAGALHKKHRGIPDTAALKWAVQTYELEQASKAHECGYCPEEEHQYLPVSGGDGTLTLAEWKAL